MTEDLTLCSVSYHSRFHLAMNDELTRRPGDRFRWLVVQNGPVEDLPQFSVVPGASRPTSIPAGNPAIKAVSYHHAMGLNLALPHIRTRFAAFMDPDFFIVPPIAEVLDYIDRRGLAFFGAPYAIDPNKRRRQDFPCAFCMFVDTKKVDIARFNFLPDSSRTDIMADTGFHIYTRYADQPHDIALPAYGGPTPFRHSRRQLSDICPDRLTKASTDAYFLDDHLWGIHLHMKLHIHLPTVGEEAAHREAEADLAVVRKILHQARQT
ncbi:MAG TPA: hypothetical protein VHX65_04545 [Pirellulales bacterium]|nr:hypothetical protein [Pirellulales bacterium]